MRILLVEDDPMIGKTLVAALQQDGYVVDWVKDGHAGRLALDTATVTFEFNPHDEGDRQQISELYRVGRVRRHVATDDSVTIEADLPRRLAARFRRGRERARA